MYGRSLQLHNNQEKHSIHDKASKAGGILGLVVTMSLYMALWYIISNKVEKSHGLLRPSQLVCAFCDHANCQGNLFLTSPCSLPGSSVFLLKYLLPIAHSRQVLRA